MTMKPIGTNVMFVKQPNLRCILHTHYLGGFTNVKGAMKPKRRGWREGILTKDLQGLGKGYKKGDTVRFRRYKTLPSENGFRLTEYEWHYVNTDNQNLIRTTELIIEGLEYIDELRLRK